MSQTKSLKVNSVINIIKTVLSIIFPLITFPYASRVLGVNGIGRVDYANSISNYFVLFAELGITTYAVREGAKIRENKEQLNQLCSEIVIIYFDCCCLYRIGSVLFPTCVKKLSEYSVAMRNYYDF
jgi:O-antigen/teichoic acid export membrane protein